MDNLSKTKHMSRRATWGEIIFVLVMLAAFIIKLSVFYDMFRLGGFETCFVFVSAAIVLALVGIAGIFSGKAARSILTVIYIFFSAVMALDGVYFSYVSKLPSVAQLGMVANFGDISGAILDLIKPKHIFLIADIPLWFLWAVDRDMIKSRFKKLTASLSREKLSRAAVSCVLIAAALGLGGYVAARADFLPEYLENEIFCYHFSDIYKVCFTKPEVRSVDKVKYIAEDCSASEYYGIAEGRNVFIIQVEAMQNFVLGAEYNGQELMPNLNELINNDTLYFKNYYYQIGGGNTADAEFGVNNSLFAPPNEAAYAKYPANDYFGLPKLLKANGYTGAYAFHGYTGSFWNREAAYVGQGFDDYTSLEDLEQTDMFPMGLSDKEFFRQSLEKISGYTEPFYSFMITLSSHYPFAIPTKDREIALDPDDESTLFGLYITSMNYTDRAIGQFIEGLKDAGLYDNSIIVIYGDHYALTNTSADNSSRVGDMLERSYTIYDVFNVPLIIHIPGSGRTEVIETAGGHLDVLPTLLCLLGIDNDKAVMFGQNLLTAEEGFVCEQTHMAIGSFISDSVFFKKPSNNIKTNYDAYEYGTMVRLNPDDFEEECNYAAERIADCASLLADNDILLSDKDKQK